MNKKPDTNEGVNKTSTAKRDAIISIAIVVFCIGVLVVYFNLNRKESEGGYLYANMLSPDYQKNMTYITNASMEAFDKLPESWFGYFGAYIPIVQGQNLTWLTKRLKRELRRASNHSSMFHIIVVGGMQVCNIDEPILEAGKRFRAPRRPNILIIIVAPTTISDETKEILEKKGIKLRLVGPPTRNHFR